MQAQDQNQQPDQPPAPQEPAQAQQQQLLVVNCSICLRDVQPGEPREQCTICPQIYHRSCINRWLILRDKQKQEINCPNCRALWALNNPPRPTCFICQQEIGPYSIQIVCRDCGIVFHQNELLTYATQLNDVQQPLMCWNCSADMSEVAGSQAASDFPNDFLIQLAQLNNDVNNFDLDSLFESESESESDED